MPTVIRQAGFEVRIYTLDHPPPHVHVWKAGAVVKIDLATAEVVEVVGDSKVEGVRIRNMKTGKATDLKVQGLFLAIGHVPATDFLRGQLDLERGYVVLRPKDGLSTQTSVEGVFAAGDVHDYHYRQAVTAAGFGSMAALDAERWLQAHKPQAHGAQSR